MGGQGWLTRKSASSVCLGQSARGWPLGQRQALGPRAQHREDKQLLELGARSADGPVSTGNQASHSNPGLPGREGGTSGYHSQQATTNKGGVFLHPLLYPGKSILGVPRGYQTTLSSHPCKMPGYHIY